jgi:hypothetical protein
MIYRIAKPIAPTIQDARLIAQRKLERHGYTDVRFIAEVRDEEAPRGVKFTVNQSPEDEAWVLQFEVCLP